MKQSTHPLTFGAKPATTQSMTLKERLFRAKHWQLFVLVFVVPILSMFVFMNLLIVGVIDPWKIFSDDSLFVIAFWVLIAMISHGTQITWMWYIATRLQDKMPEGTHLPLKRIKVFFLIPLLYVFIVAFIVATLLDPTHKGTATLIIGTLLFLLPMHFFAMFCTLHSMFFAAKALRTVELQRKTTFSDFVGEFFMIWFFPIGIWLIQPRINSIIRGEEQRVVEKKILL